MSKSRFTYELPQHISLAKQGNQDSAFNILQYLRECSFKGITPDRRTGDYLMLALGKLSYSEAKRLSQKITAKSESRSSKHYTELQKKIKQRHALEGDGDMGSFTADIDEIDKEIMRIGALVENKLNEYTDPSNIKNSKEKLKGESGSYDKAMEEVAESEGISKSTAENYHSAFQEKHEKYGEESEQYILSQNGEYLQSEKEIVKKRKKTSN